MVENTSIFDRLKKRPKCGLPKGRRTNLSRDYNAAVLKMSNYPSLRMLKHGKWNFKVHTLFKKKTFMIVSQDSGNGRITSTKNW